MTTTCLLSTVMCMTLGQAPVQPDGIRLSTTADTAALRATVGQPATLQLTRADGTALTDAYISRLVVRTPGRQDSMLDRLDAATGTVTWRFDQPGVAVVLVEAGPATLAGLGDAWNRTTYCARLIVRVGAAPGTVAPAARDPGITAKAGQKIEIMPLTDPTHMGPGDDMGVRVYFEGDKQTDLPVTVTGPRGPVTVRTDGAGTAHFPVTVGGRWQVRARRTVEGVTYTADLLFDIAAARREVRR